MKKPPNFLLSFHTNPMQMAEAFARMKGISIGDAMKFLSGKEWAAAAQPKLFNAMGGMRAATGPGIKGAAARMAVSPGARTALRAVPIIGAGLAALDAADIVTNDTNILNKGMDAAAMGIGGTLGAVGGPLGAAAGASTGKWASDSLQWLFGDKKTPDQRRMEEALMALRSGVI